MAMTQDDRQKLREAALAALDGTRNRWNVPRDAMALDWQLQTSNSFRRIGTYYGDGDVVCGTTHPRDRHPDLLAAPGVLDYVVAAQPRIVLSLLDDLDSSEGKLEQAREAIEPQLCGIEARLDNAQAVINTVASALGQLSTSLEGNAPVADLLAVIETLRSALAEVKR